MIIISKPKLFALLIICLSVTVGWESLVLALPAPSTNTIVTPGSHVKNCRATVYKSGTQAVDQDGNTGDNIKVTGADDAVIQDALNNILDAGRTTQQRICIIGAYTINAAISIPSYTIFDMSGASIILANSVNTDILRSGNYPASGNCDYVTIIGGIIDGNKANEAGNGSNVFRGCNHFLINEVTIQNTIGTSFLFRTGIDVTVRRVFVSNSATDSITCYDGCNNFRAIDNYISGQASATNGILVKGRDIGGQSASQDMIIERNQIISSTNAGWGINMLDGVSNVTVSDNHIAMTVPGEVGIDSKSTGLGSNSQIDIHDNTMVLGTGGFSIGVSVDDTGGGFSSKQVRIHDNLIQANKGVSITGVSDQISVVGNDLKVTTTPISLGASITNIITTNNVGYNPVGKVTNFIIGTFIGPCGTGTTVISATVYVVCNTDIILTCTGGTVTAIAEKDNLGNQIFSVANCAALPTTGLTIQRGYSITWTHTGAPTVSVYAI